MGMKDAGRCSPPQGMHAWLDQLRTNVARLDPTTDIDRIVWGVSETAEHLVAEHAGMAEELLHVYEQLGIVFEVTRKLTTVHEESEIVDLFLDSLRRSFAGRSVFRVGQGWNRGHSTFPWTSGCGTNSVPGAEKVECPLFRPWMGSIVERAREGATVLVDQPPEEIETPVAQVLAGPIFAGERFMGAIIMTRTASTPEFRASDMSLLESLTTFCGDLIRIHRLVREMREMSVAMVRSLVSAVDQKDEYTSGHSVRVGYFATLLGEELGLGEVDLRMLQWSALLHDVGKIGIRDDVLKKPGKLTAEEFAHIKGHPIRSHQVVRDVPQLHGALDGVLYHHEHFDGSGYPEGLVGRDIPQQARIIQIADIFDALTTTRAYRSAFPWRRALDILAEEAGTTVDREFAEVFTRLMRGLLEDDPDGWDKLIQRAERFMQRTAPRGDVCDG